MAFYTYDQNNSGGSFEFDHRNGISLYVIVEADSAGEADEKAEDIGLYFDGAYDCSCCGNRWHEAGGWWSDDEGDQYPSVFGRPVWEKEEDSLFSSIRWEQEGTPFAYVHFANGDVVGVVHKEDGTAYAVNPVRDELGWEFVPVKLEALEPPKEIEEHGTIVLEIEA